MAGIEFVGVNVHNEANEKIGDIIEVILDKSGKVARASWPSVAFSAWESITLPSPSTS